VALTVTDEVFSELVAALAAGTKMTSEPKIKNNDEIFLNINPPCFPIYWLVSARQIHFIFAARFQKSNLQKAGRVSDAIREEKLFSD
jgi:hypothetical protein